VLHIYIYIYDISHLRVKQSALRMGFKEDTSHIQARKTIVRNADWTFIDFFIFCFPLEKKFYSHLMKELNKETSDAGVQLETNKM